jgi:hypothetical protein
VVSVEPSPTATLYHSHKLKREKVTNNMVCKDAPVASLFRKLVESPELFRYQVWSGSLLDLIVEEEAAMAGKLLGDMLSSALTTFLYVPSDVHVSLAMTTFFGTSRRRRVPVEASDDEEGGAFLETGTSLDFLPVTEDAAFKLDKHPLPPFENFERSLLSHYARTAGSNTTRISVKRIGGGGKTTKDLLENGVSFPLYCVVR